MKTLIHLPRLIIISLLSLFLFACGGGGGGGDASTSTNVAPAAGTGTVTLLLTDGPTDEFKQINLTITRVEFLSDGGKHTVFSGVKHFDLLQLTNVTEIFSVLDMPARCYSKIRLTLSEIELVLHDGSKAYPSLPGNGKLDLNPRGDFCVYDGTALMIQLDMDAAKSIHVVKTGNGNKYQFRPVVFIKIIKDRFDTKLVRLTGVVNNLDTLGDDFDLCRIQAQGYLIDDDISDGRPYCVQVNTRDANASFFDANADPIRFDDLNNGDIVTVVGRFAFNGNALASAHKDSGDDRSHDDSSSDDNSSDDDNDFERLVLIAEVIWQGDLLEVNGIARSPVTTDSSRGTWFKYEVLSGGIVSSSTIPTILQPGAKIFNRIGVRQDETAIQPGIPTKVDGALAIEDKSSDLKAVLLMLDTNPAALPKLAGVISSVSADATSMILVTDNEGDRCVNIGGTFRIFERSLDDDGNSRFDQMTAFDLERGQRATVFGHENTVNGCQDADTIIYEEDGAVIQPLQEPV